jgi:hypothetical protein
MSISEGERLTMSERISSRQNKETEQVTAANRIGEQALAIIDLEFGTGYPQWKPGNCELSYHNGRHGRTVGNAALKLASLLGLSKAEQAITRNAGYAHDLIQLKGRGTDERESAEWLTAQLEKTGLFPEDMRRMGELAIIGTEPLFEDGALVGQRATELEYTSEAEELVVKSVACGDFGILHQPEGPFHAHQYFREIKGMPTEAELPFDELIPFQRNQIGLLERYRYPLKEADSILATHRPQVLAYSHDTLENLENGTIDSWEELLRRDHAFIAAYA